MGGEYLEAKKIQYNNIKEGDTKIMKLIEYLTNISKNYGNEIEQKFGGNKYKKNMTNMDNLKDLKEYISSEGNYKIKSSMGQGRWAIIPWVRIFQQDISPSAKEGFYIVYLFTNDYKKVYLSLNQGWEFYQTTFKKNAKEECEKEAKKWKEILEKNIKKYNFNTEKINLIVKETKKSIRLAKGYEYGNICSKLYDLENNTNNETTLLNDLKNLIKIYKILKERKLTNRSKDEEIKNINQISIDINQQIKNIELIDIPEPSNKSINIKKEKSTKNSNKKDYSKAAEKNKMIGERGEEIIYELEKEKISNDKELYEYFKKNNDCLKHVSKEDDSLGYDIESIEKQGNKIQPIYIEVKTSEKENEIFYISQNELEMLNNKKNYYIYRIFNINTKSPKYYKITSTDFDEKFECSPYQYVVKLK